VVSLGKHVNIFVRPAVTDHAHLLMAAAPFVNRDLRETFATTRVKMEHMGSTVPNHVEI
jgi:hypothetical protein